ncbi:unnamed protein product [Effrenium voratum]|nr:unnamed protein product [Effrenium voratum]
MASAAVGKEALPMPPGFEQYNGADAQWQAEESWGGGTWSGKDGNGEAAYASYGTSWQEGAQGPSEWLKDVAHAPAASWQESADGAGRQQASGLTGEEGATVQFMQSLDWDGGENLVLAESENFTNFGFSEALLQGIYEVGYVKPSKVQAAALPIIAGKPGEPGQSIMAQAQNGSGKTAAFTLAVLSMLRIQDDWPQAIVVCPTRELAKQNQQVMKNLGTALEVKTQLVCPSGPDDPERCPSNPRSHVLIGTPGKLSDLAKKRIIDCRGVKTLVLDEADVMLSESNQMGSQIHQIRRMLQDDPLQVLFFSATFPDDVRKFGTGLIPSSKGIKVSKKDLTVASVLQVYRECASEEEKFAQLCSLYGCLNVSQSIIFVNRRDKAVSEFGVWEIQGWTPAPLSVKFGATSKGDRASAAGAMSLSDDYLKSQYGQSPGPQVAGA